MSETLTVYTERFKDSSIVINDAMTEILSKYSLIKGINRAELKMFGTDTATCKKIYESTNPIEIIGLLVAGKTKIMDAFVYANDQKNKDQYFLLESMGSGQIPSNEKVVAVINGVILSVLLTGSPPSKSTNQKFSKLVQSLMDCPNSSTFHNLYSSVDLRNLDFTAFVTSEAIEKFDQGIINRLKLSMAGHRMFSYAAKIPDSMIPGGDNGNLLKSYKAIGEGKLIKILHPAFKGELDSEDTKVKVGKSNYNDMMLMLIFSVCGINGINLLKASKTLNANDKHYIEDVATKTSVFHIDDFGKVEYDRMKGLIDYLARTGKEPIDLNTLVTKSSTFAAANPNIKSTQSMTPGNDNFAQNNAGFLGQKTRSKTSSEVS